MQDPRRFVLPALPALAAAVAFAVPAAAVEQECHTAVVGPQALDWVQSVTIPQFDPSLGILQQVTLHMQATLGGQLGVENLATAAGQFSISNQTEFRVAVSGTEWPAPPIVLEWVFTLDPFDGTIDFAGPSGWSVQLDEGTTLDVQPADPTPFVGTGQVVVSLSGNSSTNSAGPGGFIGQTMLEGQATLTVCYTYALDCNQNGVPDEDDLGTGTSGDCNGNAVPDECDIANGTLTDGDLDGVPDECQCYVAQYCQTSPNTVGAGGLIGSSGTPSLSANHFFLRAGHLPPGEPGIFFFGDFAVDPPLTFGDGFRCVGGNTVRLLPPLHASPQGTVTRQLDFSQPPASLFLPGQTRYFQFWYRDHPQVGVGFNLTNGLAVTFCL